MRRHGFDPVSFVFGVLFVGLGVMFLADDGRFEPGVLRLVVPVVVIAIGLAVLGSAVTGRSDKPAPATADLVAAAPTVPAVGGDDPEPTGIEVGDDTASGEDPNDTPDP